MDRLIGLTLMAASIALLIMAITGAAEHTVRLLEAF